MDDFGTLARDFGFRQQGKSAPMSASKGSSTVNVGIGSVGSGKSEWNSNSTPSGTSLLGDDDGFFGSSHNQNRPNYGGLAGYDDVFGGPPRYSNPNPSQNHASSASPFDSLFQGSKDSLKSSSLPVYDKPVYDDDDDDIFDGVPGLKSSASVKYADVFSAMASAAAPNNASQYDDLLGNFGRAEQPESKGSSGKRSGGMEQEVLGFDDLIPGFGGSSPPSSSNRETSETNRRHHSAVPSTKSSSSVLDDPFVVLESTSIPAYSSSGLFTDPLEHINKPSNSDSAKADGSSVSGGVFDDINAFDGLTKSVPLFSSEIDKNGKNRSPLRAGRNLSPSHTMDGNGATKKVSMNNFESVVHKKMPADDYRESHQTLFDSPTGLSNSHKTTGRSGFHPKDVNAYEASSQDLSPKSDGNLETGDDVWLSISEIPLFTQPTSAPPPSRAPPTLDIIPESVPKADTGSSAGLNVKGKVGVADSVKSFGVISVEELEDFAMGMPRTYADERADTPSSEEEMIETNSTAAASAAAMKEAMDRAEVKFKQAREVRERERDAKSVRSRESAQHEDEKTRKDAQERVYREKQERLDHEREQREREEREREKKRLEKEREREREIERGKARQAVERATKEARDRAATEARLRAERAAVGKVNAEARERAERAAVQRAQAEARERAAAEAKERAEKVATEARERAAAETRQRAIAEARERASVERAASEVRIRAERAAVERAAAEARERAAAEAQERAAAAARERQQKNDNDLESFFSMGARPNSAPRQRATASNPAFDAQFQSKGGSDGARWTSAGASSNMRKASSTTNIVDDLASMFGAATSGDFQEVEGETEERRSARLERHQRTLERAKKALAEKNERDMQTQRDQAERHRIGETLDIEIKRWAAGKEGNLRALLSTLQYVLWPECGWQPVSLTDLITGASVKKVYRKATLCIHPDKVQQKGANLQQKYIAEKVFDLLKEAWNKLNSEELF